MLKMDVFITWSVVARSQARDGMEPGNEAK